MRITKAREALARAHQNAQPSQGRPAAACSPDGRGKLRELGRKIQLQFAVQATFALMTHEHRRMPAIRGALLEQGADLFERLAGQHGIAQIGCKPLFHPISLTPRLGVSLVCTAALCTQPIGDRASQVALISRLHAGVRHWKSPTALQQAGVVVLAADARAVVVRQRFAGQPAAVLVRPRAKVLAAAADAETEPLS